MPQLSFFVTNLLIPGDPAQLTLTTPSGGWTLKQVADYARAKQVVTAVRGRRASELPIVDTYILEHVSFGQLGRSVDEQACAELTPILLAASFATGMSVTIRNGTLAGPALLGDPTPSWPRPRAMDGPSWAVNTSAEFAELVQAFLTSWPEAGKKEKALLLVHHWLDALACWSMEDLYLSATTLLQIIVATEVRTRRAGRLDFFQGLKYAATRKRVAKPDFYAKEMRDSLVHEGRLAGRWLKQMRVRRVEATAGKTDSEMCRELVAEVLNWFDAYLHAALGLGSVAKIRFGANDFANLNAYSLS